MKKIIVMILSVILCFGLVACGGGGDNGEQAEAEPAKPLDLTGDWEQTNKNSETDYMEATISGETITINWVFEEDSTTALYWAGTYAAPAESTEEYSWTSENDRSQTDSALMASTSDTKEFTYQNGVLSFEASAMGVTTTVEMEKVE